MSPPSAFVDLLFHELSHRDDCFTFSMGPVTHPRHPLFHSSCCCHLTATWKPRQYWIRSGRHVTLPLLWGLSPGVLGLCLSPLVAICWLATPCGESRATFLTLSPVTFSVLRPLYLPCCLPAPFTSVPSPVSRPCRVASGLTLFCISVIFPTRPCGQPHGTASAPHFPPGPVFGALG